MTAENLDGMSAEQLMLRDFIYELHDLLKEADRKADSSYRAGVMAVAGMLEHQLVAFEIDQSRFARQMPDIQRWFVGNAR